MENRTINGYDEAKRLCEMRGEMLPKASQLRLFYRSLGDIEDLQLFYLNDVLEGTIDRPLANERLCLIIRYNIRRSTELQLDKSQAEGSCSEKIKLVVCSRLVETSTNPPLSTQLSTTTPQPELPSWLPYFDTYTQKLCMWPSFFYTLTICLTIFVLALSVALILVLSKLHSVLKSNDTKSLTAEKIELEESNVQTDTFNGNIIDSSLNNGEFAHTVSQYSPLGRRCNSSIMADNQYTTDSGYFQNSRPSSRCTAPQLSYIPTTTQQTISRYNVANSDTSISGNYSYMPASQLLYSSYTNSALGKQSNTSGFL